MVQEPAATSTSQLYRRLTFLRWLSLAAGLLITLIHQLLEGIIRANALPKWELIELVYALGIMATIWLVLTWLRRAIKRTETAEHALGQVLGELTEANQRLEFLLRVNRRLAAAEDDVELADVIISQTMELAPAVACSLIRFDANQLALASAVRIGQNPIELDSHIARFPAKEVRRQCKLCVQRWPEGAAACGLLAQPQPVEEVRRIHCLELTRGNDQIFGILSIHLTDFEYPDEKEQMLLEMMASEMALALESHALRSQELGVLHRLQRARQLRNLQDELAGVLADTVDVLQVAGGFLFLADSDSGDLELKAEVGRPLGEAMCLVAGLAAGAGRAEAPLVIRDLEEDGRDGARSLLIAPLRSGERMLGSLVFWNTRPEAFTRRHTQLVATVAGQAALLVENHRLYLRGEQQAALAERARLAREIHDGLAQTLSYVKLRTSQIIDRLGQGDYQIADAGLVELQGLLGEAYVDAREAIDGLRIKAGNDDLSAWMHAIVSEFEVLSGVPVSADPAPNVTLPLEIHTQLQRIVQEALSNVRKHADATRVWVEWGQDDGWLTMQIRDNGRGFDPADVPQIARHGLSIMSERAELLSASIRVASEPDSGTRIIVRLPSTKWDETRQDE